MSKTSIHFLEVKSTSEIHNFRKKKFDYCREDLRYLNEQFVEDSISSRRQKIENQCKEYSGRKLQKNAKPIREGVVVIDEKTTMDDLKMVANNLQRELGIKVFQIFIHRDEGHYDENKVWKTNQHAHLVAEWIDERTKKMLKLNPLQMSQMQDICAMTLNMERGNKSSRKHLGSVAYKLKVTEEALLNLHQKGNNEFIQIAHNLERKKKEYKDLKMKNDRLVNANRIESLILERDIFLQDLESQVKDFSYDDSVVFDENLKNLIDAAIKVANWNSEAVFKWLEFPEFYNKARYIMEEILKTRFHKR